MATWLPLIFMQCLIYSYVVVVQCSVSQPETADCEFPQFNAPPSLYNNYPFDPRTPPQELPPWSVPDSPVIPWMPTPGLQLPPPPSPSSPTGAPLMARQLSPPPLILPKIPRQLIPPPPPPHPPLTRTTAQTTSSQISPGSFPQTPTQSGSSSSSSSSSFRQLQFGQQPFMFQPKPSSSSSRAKAVGTAVGVTLAITIIAAGVSICLILKYCKRRRNQVQNNEAALVTPPAPGTGAGGRKNLKGLIVDEKGQDMVYWRKDDEENGKGGKSLSTESYDLYKERVRKEKDNIQQSASLSTGVRFESDDKKQTVNAQALAAPEAPLPPLFPSRRKGLGKHANEKENLKPLQREEVSINAELPMTWQKHNEGALSYDGDLMEAMFGSMAIKRRTSNTLADKSLATPSNGSMISSNQIFLLDPQRSQNIASILRSIKVSRQELLVALIEGKGLEPDTLRKLSRITPTKREESLILTFRGHPPCLAQAESFLYYTMKSVSLAFPRINAMLFRLNYITEIQYLDEHVRTLEKGCYELRESVLLFKLIQATFRAGNEMNGGGENRAAYSLNLTSLWKLFNVQTPDGKNTLIQSVVEGLAISEGKQCVIDRDKRLNLPKRNMDSSSSLSRQNSKKFMILGLPLVSGLSAEFPSARKAAAVDYYTYFLTASSTLAAGLNNIRDTIRQCNGASGGFVTEMNTFLNEATQELSEKTEEQMKVIQLVKRTTEYYQSGAPTNEDASPFQLFSIVKEFLDMVDQACKYLSENLQTRKAYESETESVLVNPPPI